MGSEMCIRDSQEGIKFLRELLDDLLIFVELLQIIDGHLVHSNPLGLFAVDRVADDATFQVRARHDGQLERPGEALVALGVVVL